MILEPMQPMAVDLRALRALLTPEIRIVPGRALMARVVAAGTGGRGSISIAGLLVDAQLPASVRAGDELRLLVADVNAQRVLLTIAGHGVQGPAAHAAGSRGADAQAAGSRAQAPVHAGAQAGSGAGQPPPVGLPVALPGGGSLSVAERDAGGGGHGGDRSHTVTLRYEAPSLGAVDLRFVLRPESLALNVTVAPGTLPAARAGAADLRRALADALSRPASVTVSTRGRPLDLYA